jgi:hypothetical protein
VSRFLIPKISPKLALAVVTGALLVVTVPLASSQAAERAAQAARAAQVSEPASGLGGPLASIAADPGGAPALSAGTDIPGSASSTGAVDSFGSTTTSAGTSSVTGPAVTGAAVAEASAPVGSVGVRGSVAAPAVVGPTTIFGMAGPSGAALTSTQSSLGISSRIHGHFVTWANTTDFPTSQATTDRAQGAVPLYTWEPQDWNAATPGQPAYSLATILSGAHDTYIKRWAGEVKAYGHPVMIRLMPEMNGNWEVWSPGVNGNTVAQFVPSWQRVVNLFRAAGATNVIWVWCPMAAFPGSTPMPGLYPGAGYVDWVAMDGYNWGTLHSSGWQTYSQIFSPTITSFGTLAPGKPIMIAEIGAPEKGGSKPAWVSNALASAPAAGVRAVVWFEMVQETDWSLMSSAATTAAAKTALTASAYRKGNAMALTTLESWARAGK